MAINEVSGAQQTTQQRVEKKYDKNGKLQSISIFKDVNGDGKEDLYSVTIFPMCFCSDTHEKTRYDDDGDGFVDRVVTRDFSNLNGEQKLKKEEEIVLDKRNKVKMIDTNKPQNTERTIKNLGWSGVKY